MGTQLRSVSPSLVELLEPRNSLLNSPGVNIESDGGVENIVVINLREARKIFSGRGANLNAKQVDSLRFVYFITALIARKELPRM